MIRDRFGFHILPPSIRPSLVCSGQATKASIIIPGVRATSICVTQGVLDAGGARSTGWHPGRSFLTPLAS